MSEPQTLFLVGKREGGKRLDQFLHERIPGLSRTRIQQAIRERVELSWGVRARPATPVRAGGEVRIGYTPLHEHEWEHQVFILKGNGSVFDGQTARPFQEGDVIFVPGGERHQFKNGGQTPAQILCLIPSPDSCSL